jgi:hypothetical protein
VKQNFGIILFIILTVPSVWGDYSPTLFVSTFPNDANAVELLDTQGASLSSSFYENTNEPIRLNLLTHQGLRLLSVYDLRMTKAVLDVGGLESRFKVPTTLRLIEANSDPGFLELQGEVTPLKNNELNDRISWVNHFSVKEIRRLTSHALSSPTYLNNLRDGVIFKLKENAEYNKPQITDTDAGHRIGILLKSVAPLVVTSSVNIDGGRAPLSLSRSSESHEVYFSFPKVLSVHDKNGQEMPPKNWHFNPIDYQVSPEKINSQGILHFNHISLGAQKFQDHSEDLNLMVLRSLKKYSEPNSFHLMVTFGKLNPAKTFYSSQGTLKIPLEFSDLDSSLLLSAYLKKTAGPNSSVMENAVNSFTNFILQNYKIQIGIHRLALRLTRQASSDLKSSVENLYSFETKDIKVEPQYSIVHVRLSTVVSRVPRNSFTNFLKDHGLLSVFDDINHPFFDSPLESKFAEALGLKCFTQGFIRADSLEPQRVCAKDFESLEGLAPELKNFRTLIKNYLNDKVIGITNAALSKAVDEKIVLSMDELDIALRDAIMTVVKHVSHSEELLKNFKHD